MTTVHSTLALFRKSVLKQAKFRQISAMMEDPTNRSNLDLGGDNGVLSFLLRQKGGTWSSGDLDEKTVGSIRNLVGDRVYRLDGSTLPFPDDSLDQIVVIENGRIIERGSHDALMQLNGHYSHLFSLQAKGYR